MFSKQLTETIREYPDFPKKGILFRDIMPILQNPDLFSELISEMSSSNLLKECEAIISIDARGFIFGSAIALLSKKPMLVARKIGKLPGDLITEKYLLEYGSNELAIQKEPLNLYDNFVIVDDLLATGGTVKCIENLLARKNKKVLGLLVVIELVELLGKSKFKFPVESILKF